MSDIHGTGKECLDLMVKLNKELFTAESQILDIGCGDPGSFFYLFHSAKFNHYTGIDLNERITVRVPTTHDQPIPEDLVISSDTTMYEQYEKYYKYVINNSDKLDKPSFQRTFRFMQGTAADDFLNQEEKIHPKFDLIFLYSRVQSWI